MTHKDGQWYEGVPETPGIYWVEGYSHPIVITNPRCSPNEKFMLYRICDIPPKPPIPKPRPEKIDTPVLVRSGDCQHWFRRYLAGWTEEGLIRTFACGQTSWTTEGERYEATWDHWKLPEDE